MLNRQRTILSLIHEAEGVASHLSVTKWAFLLREECPSRGGSAFYQFLPYKYGPFSFCLFHEASALVRDGLLHDKDQKWLLTRSGLMAARKIHPKVHDDILRIVRAHARKRPKTLIDYVYKQHPWYTINSEIRQLEPRPKAKLAVYTAGYEGLLIDGFLNGLLKVGIRRLIDVRNNPISRRYGFHKTTLGRLCGKVEIEYIHFPQLGIASKDRQELDLAGARDALFDEYARKTLRTETESIEAVARLVRSAPSALMCMEARPCDCHRSHLAKSVAIRARLPIQHLELQP